jgi:hypothetical protein
MNKTIIYILGLLLFVAGSVCAQQLACDKIVPTCIADMAKYQDVKPGKIYFMEMTTESRYKKTNESKNTKHTAQIYFSEDKVYYNSPQVSLFADSQKTYMAVHEQKIVLRTNTPLHMKRERLQMVSGIQDSLFRHSKLSSCIDAEIEGRKAKEIVYTTDEKFRKATGVASQTYYYDLAEKRIFKAVTRYAKESIRQQDIISYTKIDFDHRSMPVQSTSGWLFNKDGSIATRYRGYEFIDN